MTDIKGDPKENSDAVSRVYDEVQTAIGDLAASSSADQNNSPDAKSHSDQNSGAATNDSAGENDTAPGSTVSLQCRSVESVSYTADFTGLFFIGIFLGLLFLMATVLIMYYKQLTEGYEDRKRFEILQNVGMSHAEVRRSINSQILIVFFLPLVTAGIHVAFVALLVFRVVLVRHLLAEQHTSESFDIHRTGRVNSCFLSFARCPCSAACASSQ